MPAGGLALLAAIGLVVVATMLAPWLKPGDPNGMDFTAVMQPPSWPHPMGTDHLGRDMLARVLYAGRPTLLIAFVIVVASGLVGIPLGIAAGFLEGAFDLVVMRCLEIGFALPPLVLAVALIGALGPGIVNLVLALVLVYAPLLARIARGATRSVCGELYVAAARAVGEPAWRLMTGQILPNIAGMLLSQSALVFCYALLAEASLSFIGLGTQPDNPSWGRLLTDAIPMTSVAPWMGIFPGVVIVITVSVINLAADRWGDALDSRVGISAGEPLG